MESIPANTSAETYPNLEYQENPEAYKQYLIDCLNEVYFRNPPDRTKPFVGGYVAQLMEQSPIPNLAQKVQEIKTIALGLLASDRRFDSADDLHLKKFITKFITMGLLGLVIGAYYEKLGFNKDDKDLMFNIRQVAVDMGRGLPYFKDNPKTSHTAVVDLFMSGVYLSQLNDFGPEAQTDPEDIIAEGQKQYLYSLFIGMIPYLPGSKAVSMLSQVKSFFAELTPAEFDLINKEINTIEEMHINTGFARRTAFLMGMLAIFAKRKGLGPVLQYGTDLDKVYTPQCGAEVHYELGEQCYSQLENIRKTNA